MIFRGVIFDMDGTITAPNLDFAGIKEEAGIGDVDMLDYLRAATGKEYERVYKILMRFEEGGVANAKLNSGARTLLRYLAQQKIPTALLTRNSRKSVEGVCHKLKLKFDITITREDGPHKPAPEPIWNILKQWKMSRQEVLMVGDYKWDVLCAKAAGIPCALLLNEDPLPDWSNDVKYHILRLTEVIDVIEGKWKSTPSR